jgi:hypothetical protein
MNVNRLVAHAMMAINAALSPYQTFSQRQLAKRGETSALFLQELLFSIVSTLWLVGAIFSAKMMVSHFTPGMENVDLSLSPQSWLETSSNRD